MWRYWAGGGAGLAALGAGALLWTGRSDAPAAALPPPPAATEQREAAPEPVPEATEKTREERRFGRYDKDRDGRITREEYLASRRKAYARLDANGDGRLSFEEWAVKRKPARAPNCPPPRASAAAEEES